MIERFIAGHWYKYDWDKPVRFCKTHPGKYKWTEGGIYKCTYGVAERELDGTIKNYVAFDGIEGGILYYHPVNLERFVDVTVKAAEQGFPSTDAEQRLLDKALTFGELYGKKAAVFTEPLLEQAQRESEKPLIPTERSLRRETILGKITIE